jgi:hypothetical protein
MRHQHRLQQQPVLVACTSPALDIGYRVVAWPGSNASIWAPGHATNRYQMEKATKAPVCDIDLCPFCSHWHRVMPRPGAALCPRQKHRLALWPGTDAQHFAPGHWLEPCLWSSPINTPALPPRSCRELTVHGSRVRGGEANFFNLF